MIWRDALEPVNARVLGPLDAAEMTPLPSVFLLGNHSSGQSTFINYVMGRDVQSVGVAPTDDSFSIICSGPQDMDQDGHAVVGDPDFGFGGLRPYGTTLLNHLNLKVRSEIAVENIMLVDSPGMIDSPTELADLLALSGAGEEGAAASAALSRDRRTGDRGYDFEAVTRWFAKRADVILLFFDPDKPGTTGETLACLTSSLAGLDHKTHILLNKADQFTKMHDFARSYGSLCWNLSKVIGRKDLPRIYTMCVPREGDAEVEAGSSAVGAAEEGDATQAQTQAQASASSGSSGSISREMLMDLQESRDSVVREVFKAPERRLDNAVTGLFESARTLRLHTSMTEKVRLERRSVWLRHHATTFAVGAGGGAISLAGLWLGQEMWCLGTGSVTLLGLAATHVLMGNWRKREEEWMVSEDGLERVRSSRRPSRCWLPRCRRSFGPRGTRARARSALPPPLTLLTHFATHVRAHSHNNAPAHPTHTRAPASRCSTALSTPLRR